MERKDIVKKLIKQKGYSLKGFSEKIDIPYTTLHSILKRSIGNASVDNVIEICKGLGITVEELENYSKANIKQKTKIELSETEKEIIDLYRELSNEDKLKARYKFEGIVEMLKEQSATDVKKGLPS